MVRTRCSKMEGFGKLYAAYTKCPTKHTMNYGIISESSKNSPSSAKYVFSVKLHAFLLPQC